MLKDSIGPYSIIEKAGEGAFGIVWKVRCENDGHTYAIKEISKTKITPQLLDNLISEVQILLDLSHENIVKCYKTLESKKNYYIILEYCEGGDLSRYLRKVKRPSIQDGLCIMKQIRDSYKYLMSHNILHRDIKLENILIADLDEMKIKLSDFGCSKADSIGTTICGTPKYMALEVMENTTKYDYKADLWSIGLVFWELLFGIDNFPFSEKSKEALKNDIKKYNGPNLRFPSYPVYPQVFYEFFKGILNVSPQLRFDIDEFFNHPIFAYDGNEPDIKNCCKNLEANILGGFTEIGESGLAFKNSNLVSSTDDLNHDVDSTTCIDDLSRRIMIFSDIKKNYNTKILEVDLIKSVGTALFDLTDPKWDDEFSSNYNCLCIVVVKKALLKAETALKTLEKGINSFKIQGFMEFIECPNEYILIKEELQNLTGSLKKIDDLIYAELLNHCYSQDFLESVNKFLYLKIEAEGKLKFISAIWKFVFGNSKYYIPDYEFNKFEKNLQRTGIILKGKVLDNLSLFY